jgi:histidinol phosphatase-like PHP family hydrolase
MWAPPEMIRSARDLGQTSIALTDHASLSNFESILESLLIEREAAKAWGDIEVFVGLEITHVPAKHIAGMAKKARRAGAEVILVHGETLSEPVEPGTNRASVECQDIDILAHPGLISEEDASLAMQNGIFLEITAKRGHSLTNGHVAKVAQHVGASMLVNTDAHDPADLITAERAIQIALGAGIPNNEALKIVNENAKTLIHRIRNRK